MTATKILLPIGGSGSGKSYGLIEPNLLQKHSSYVVTDPKGTILPEVGNALKDDYEIRVLNTINFKKSMHYNPLAYIHSQKDILRVVNVLMKNTKGDDQKSGGDPFWDKAESLLYHRTDCVPLLRSTVGGPTHTYGINHAGYVCCIRN